VNQEVAAEGNLSQMALPNDGGAQIDGGCIDGDETHVTLMNEHQAKTIK